MDNWIVDYIQEELETELTRVKVLKEMATKLKDNYKGVLETDDKFEVKYHEYWRTVELMTDNEITKMNEILKHINEMKNEEVEVLEAAYRDDEENRAIPIGII